MGVFSPKVGIFKKVFAFYARSLDAGPLIYYWCVAHGP